MATILLLHTCIVLCHRWWWTCHGGRWLWEALAVPLFNHILRRATHLPLLLPQGWHLRYQTRRRDTITTNWWTKLATSFSSINRWLFWPIRVTSLQPRHLTHHRVVLLWWQLWFWCLLDPLSPGYCHTRPIFWYRLFMWF